MNRQETTRRARELVNRMQVRLEKARGRRPFPQVELHVDIEDVAALLALAGIGLDAMDRFVEERCKLDAIARAATESTSESLLLEVPTILPPELHCAKCYVTINWSTE